MPDIAESLRPFADAVIVAGLPATTRPYELRHSYVSLMIAEGASVIEVASQAGHSPMMALNTYAHLFDEHDRASNRPAADLIREARATLGVAEVSVLCPPEIGRDGRAAGNPCKTAMGDPGLEPGTYSLSGLLGATDSRVRRSKQSKMAANRAVGGMARRPGATWHDRSEARKWPDFHALAHACRSA